MRRVTALISLRSFANRHVTEGLGPAAALLAWADLPWRGYKKQANEVRGAGSNLHCPE